MNGKIKLVFGILALAAVITGAVIAYNALSENYSPDIPSIEAEHQPTAPDFTVFDIDGNEVKLSDFFGQPTVVNFWASWCPPCRAHKPVFDMVYDEVKDDVAFLMVNLTGARGETVESASAYITEHGYRFPVYYDTTQEAARTYSITAVPTTLFIDRDGHIVTEHKGQMSENQIRAGIGLISSS
jgi:thiol-disulfide isomerase/thioredoxin